MRCTNVRLQAIIPDICLYHTRDYPSSVLFQMPDSLGIRSIAHLLDTQPRTILVVVGCAIRHDAYIAIREDLEIPMSGDTQQHDVAMDGLRPLKGLSVPGT